MKKQNQGKKNQGWKRRRQTQKSVKPHTVWVINNNLMLINEKDEHLASIKSFDEHLASIKSFDDDD